MFKNNFFSKKNKQLSPEQGGVPKYSDIWSKNPDANAKDRREYADDKKEWDKLTDEEKKAHYHVHKIDNEKFNLNLDKEKNKEQAKEIEKRSEALKEITKTPEFKKKNRSVMDYYNLEKRGSPPPKNGEAVFIYPSATGCREHEVQTEDREFEEVEIQGGAAHRLPKSHEENKKNVDKIKKEPVPVFSDVWTPPDDLNAKDQADYEEMKEDWEKLSDKEKIAELKRWQESELEIEQDNEAQKERILKARKRQAKAREKHKDQDLER